MKERATNLRKCNEGSEGGRKEGRLLRDSVFMCVSLLHSGRFTEDVVVVLY